MRQNNHLLNTEVPCAEILKQIEIEQINLRTMINNISGVMWSVDRNYNLVTSNTAFDAMVEMMTGKKIEKGHSVFIKGFTEEELKNFKQYYDRAFAGETFTIEQYNDTYDRWHDISFHPIHRGYTIIGTSCCSYDITERKKAAAKLFEANRLYAFSSQINQAIIYTKEVQALFDEVCRIAINTGRFELACINSVDETNNSMNIVACAGVATKIIRPSGNMTYSNGGPVDTAIQSGKYLVINNFSTQPESSPWRQHAIANNFNSAIVLPVKKAGEITYILSLFSGKANNFDANETKLLEEVTANISFALDVFEKEKKRLKAEQDLKYKEKRLAHAQKIAHVGYWELDFETRVATWSEEHCRIFGVDTADNMHSYESWLSFVHPDDFEYVLKMSKQGEMSRKRFSFYHRIIRRDGTIRHIHSQNQFEFNDQGIPVSFFGASQDVTEMKQAEEKLKHSAFRFAQAQAIAHLGNWELDFATGIAVWSEEACRIYGLSPGENIQSYEAWISFIHPDDMENVMKVIKHGQATLTNTSMYHRIIRRDGTVRHLHSITYFDLDSAGKPTGLYGVAHDITDEKISITKLKAQNEQLREIAWIQSHKVRGPLATLLGLTQLFNSGYAVNTEEIISGILATSQKLDTVIHEIVDKTHTIELPDDLSSYAA